MCRMGCGQSPRRPEPMVLGDSCRSCQFQFPAAQVGTVIQQPGYCGAVAEVGLQLLVGIAQERSLTGQAPYTGCQVRIEGQEFVPDITVLFRCDVENAEPVIARGE